MADPADALARFDAGAPVRLAELTGRWCGRGLPTGSRLDGLLEAHGWYGKEILDPESVHPLLFRARAGRPFPVDPGLAPVGLLVRHPELFRTPGARLAFAAVARRHLSAGGTAAPGSSTATSSPRRSSTTRYRSSTSSAGSTATPCSA